MRTIMNTAKRLFAMQVIAHLSIIPMIIYGELQHYLIALAVYFVTGCLGMTILYHRQISHNAFDAPKWFRTPMIYISSIGLTGSALAWTAIHRKHHAFMDEKEDPHSPKHIGMLRAHFCSMFAPVDMKYVRRLLTDPDLQIQHRYYFAINAVYALVIGMIDPFAIVYAWLFPAAVLWNGGSSVLSYSHRKGKPHNDWWLGILVWGEGWHKNHHDSPSSPEFHPKYDISKWIIKCIQVN